MDKNFRAKTYFFKIKIKIKIFNNLLNLSNIFDLFYG